MHTRHTLYLAAILTASAMHAQTIIHGIGSGPGGGAGTVTSVAVTAPTELTVTGSPVTSTGTLAFSWANQLTSRIFAAPCGTTGTPTFRVLCAADIPALDPTKITGTAVITSDSRLSDARTPTAHASTHAAAGSDPITLAQSQVTGLTAALAGKQVSGPYITGITGDVVATGPGSVAATIQADSVALGTDTTGGYAASSTEGGPATTATALAANGTNCSAPNFARGVDASGNCEGAAIVATDLPSTTVTPGSYTNASITVDQQGRITTASSGSAGDTLPVVDTTAVVKGSSDATKLLRFEVDGFTTGTTRVATPPDSNFTMARTDAAQTFTGRQTFTTAMTLADGSAGAPSFEFDSGAPGNGLYHLANYGIGVSIGGSLTDVFSNFMQVRSDGGVSWSSGSNPDSGIDLRITRKAAAILSVDTTAGNTAGWIVSAGSSYLSANMTNATTTPTATGLSVTVLASRKYSFIAVAYVADSTAADGVAFDFDGGTATVTNFRTHCKVFDAALAASAQVTAIATDITAATITGDTEIVCHGSFESNGAGTLLLRAWQNAHTAGTLTVYRGSHLRFWDTP